MCKKKQVPRKMRLEIFASLRGYKKSLRDSFFRFNEKDFINEVHASINQMLNFSIIDIERRYKIDDKKWLNIRMEINSELFGKKIDDREEVAFNDQYY